MASSPQESENLLLHVQSSQFRIYNRLTATKPLDHLVGILNMGPSVAAALKPKRPPESIAKKGEDDDSDDEDWAHLNVSTAAIERLLGIRLGGYFEGPDHIFIVDSAIEYRLDRDLFSFEDHDVERFVRYVAAPRIAIATWTLLEDAAASAQYKLDGNMVIPPDAITNSVLGSYRRARKNTGQN